MCMHVSVYMYVCMHGCVVNQWCKIGCFMCSMHPCWLSLFCCSCTQTLLCKLHQTNDMHGTILGFNSEEPGDIYCRMSLVLFHAQTRSCLDNKS